MSTERAIDLKEIKDTEILDLHSHVNSRSARNNFSSLINKARVEKESVVITDRGSPAAAVIPIAELKALDIVWESLDSLESYEASYTKMKELLSG